MFPPPQTWKQARESFVTKDTAAQTPWRGVFSDDSPSGMILHSVPVRVGTPPPPPALRLGLGVLQCSSLWTLSAWR